MSKNVIVTSTIVALFLGGCSTAQLNQNMGKIGGTTIGATGGAVIGKQIGGDRGMYIGAVAGGILGYLIGDEIDKRRQNLEKIATSENIKLQFSDLVDDRGEKIGQSFLIEDDGQFSTGKHVLNKNAVGYFEKIAKEFANSKQKVMIVGHTDDVGSSTSNQELSEKRAISIASLFEKNGVRKENIYFYGVGELEPIASNNTKEGRAKNRRVEIVEAPTEEDIAKYALSQESNKGFVKAENTPTQKNQNLKPTKKEVPVLALNEPMLQQDNPKSLKNSEDQKDKAFMNKFSNLFGSNKDPKVNNNLEKPLDMPNLQNPTSTLVQSGVVRNVYGEGNPKEKGKCKNPYWYYDEKELDLAGVKAHKAQVNELIATVGHYQPKERPFSFFTEAQASDGSGFYKSCLADSYKEKGEIKNYATGKVIAAQDLAKQIPWMQGSVWVGNVNSNQLVVTPIGVYSENLEPSTCPEVAFLKQGDNIPTYATSTKITTYRGTDAFIYRIYPEDTSKFQCADIAFSYQNTIAPQGIIYYKQNNEQYKKEFTLKQLTSNKKGNI